MGFLGDLGGVLEVFLLFFGLFLLPISQHSFNVDVINNTVMAHCDSEGVPRDHADDAIRLTPPRIMTLEDALEFIADDELVECTPESIRVRKRVLDHNGRKRATKS